MLFQQLPGHHMRHNSPLVLHKICVINYCVPLFFSLLVVILESLILTVEVKVEQVG